MVVPGPHGRKVGKLLRKNMRKAHFRGREGRKGTNRPRAVGVPVSFARGFKMAGTLRNMVDHVKERLAAGDQLLKAPT